MHPSPPLGAPQDGRPQKLFCAKELAKRWCVPPAHVYRLSREGELPTVELGRYRPESRARRNRA